MIPTNSNLNKENCSPVSSNCIVWQGPDISCINLCKGDSVSEVIYRLAEEICDLKEQLNLSDLDLKCIIDNCALCPDPEKTLKVVLQLLIDKVCTLEEMIAQLTGGSTDETLIRIATCFYPDFTDGNGDITKDVTISQYVQKIAQKLCILINEVAGLNSDITNINNTLIDHDDRITALENEGGTTVTLTCITPGVKPIDEAVESIEQDYCTLKETLGGTGDLLDVIDKECTLPVKKLTDPTTDLWTGVSTNIAETLDKMWLAICDLRGAVKAIQDNCCKITCDDIMFGFDVKALDEETLLFFFLPKTSIPNGFNDCDETLGNKFLFTDGNGAQWFTYIKIREDVLEDAGVLANGYEIDLSLSPLDATTGLTITSDLCLTNGDTTCIKCFSTTVPPVAPDCCVITNTSDSENTIVYTICPTTTTTTAAPIT
jgi:hypothetical protein